MREHVNDMEVALTAEFVVYIRHGTELLLKATAPGRKGSILFSNHFFRLFQALSNASCRPLRKRSG
jgi:hypothetical protein